MDSLLSQILESVLLVESPSIQNINDAIDNKYRVIINYRTKGEDVASGPRVIEVYAYGLTKAGNPVIRAFQPYGDTTSHVPSWKFFRLDRITDWKPTGQRFTRPASDYYQGIGQFNPNGDKTMSVVYKIVDFGKKSPYSGITRGTSPRKKDSVARMQQQQPSTNEPYKTDSERNMERLRQQLNNPIYIDQLRKRQAWPQSQDGEENMAKIRQTMKKDDYTNQLKNQNAFQDVVRKLQDNPQISGPKEKNIQNNLTNRQDTDIYKTDSERRAADILNQLKNPRYVDPKVLDRYNAEKNRRRR